MYSVNPGLINPKRLFNWEGTIKKVSDYDYWRSTPLINKPWFINPGLTLLTFCCSGLGDFFADLCLATSE